MSLKKNMVSIIDSMRLMVREAQLLSHEINEGTLNSSQYDTLLELDKHHTLSLNEITSYLSLNKSTTSRNIKFLQEEQYIMPLVDPTDNRVKPFTLTKKGRDLLKRLEDKVNEAVLDALAVMSNEEIEAAVQGMHAYSKALVQSRRQQGYVISKLKKDDSSKLGEIMLTVLKEFGAQELTSAFEDEEIKNMYKAYTAKGFFCYTVHKDGELCGGAGVARLENLKPDSCEIRKMYLIPSTRGFGIGKKLLDKCIEEASEMGFKRIYAKTATRMPLAITLFQKENFNVVPAPFKDQTKNHNFIWFVKEI